MSAAIQSRSGFPRRNTGQSKVAGRDAPSAEMAWRRIKGGFRRVVETELGTEQACCSCGELWPVDKEFYVVSATALSYECKACTSERRAGPATSQR